MFRKNFLTSFRLAKPIKQGGQVSILFALLMPILFLFVGVALDFGWYYLNVSRLQNAADAAAVAGAQAISDNFSDYKNISLVNHYPGKVSNQYRANGDSELKTIENSKVVAEEYAGKNLSGNKDKLINSWTKNEIETEGPTLYEQDDNLYFVVKLKDTIRHFFLSSWFDDMVAPVTAVAMISKTAIAPTDTIGGTTGGSSPMPDLPSMPEMPNISPVSDMPALPDNPLIISETFKENIETDRNQNVIVGNWQVQNAYKNDNKTTETIERDGQSVQVTKYEAIFETPVYSERWNHFQDFYNHYATGDLYRTGTVTVLDDVKTDNDGNITSYGVISSVAATSASINTDKNSIAYNPGHPGTLKTHKAGIDERDTVGLPYTADKLDSINIDFRTEVTLSGKWLEEDWDISKGFDGVTPTKNKKGWNDSNKETIGRLRIHTSINFDGVYKAREDDNRQKENKGSYDVLWARIESEPILYHPDKIRDNQQPGYKINEPNLNSVNQIIINANKSNTGTGNRPYIIFYDGPETNDVYDSYKSRTDVLHRKSLPVILNLYVPFNAILYMPKSPVVIIGDAKDYFQGFVVAQKYMRLKDDSDFVLASDPTSIEALSLYSMQTYYAKDDKNTNKTPYYKITDENGIEMFVDQYGDIQFADLSAPPTRYGTYSTFGRKELDDPTNGNSYNVPQSSYDNMLLSGK